MDVVSGVENKMASDAGAGDVEGESNDKCTKENILYDLTIQAEWQQDQEIFVRICCFVGSLPCSSQDILTRCHVRLFQQSGLADCLSRSAVTDDVRKYP